MKGYYTLMPATNSDSHQGYQRGYWPLVLCAALILMITMGARQTTGLFVSPINSSTGLGIVAISFALAVGQFMYGLSQPILGALADKFGSIPVLVVGAMVLASGLLLTPLIDSQWGLIFTMGVLLAMGAGAGSFSVLIGGVGQRLPAGKQSFAAGFINAGGSLGQFVFAPLLQFVIGAAGWAWAMVTMAAAALLTIPLALPLRKKAMAHVAGAISHATSSTAQPASFMTLRQQLRIAFRNPNYLLLHAGFFTCGFHVAFLVTHLPGEVQLCSLPATVASTSIALIGAFNVLGSLTAGVLGQRYRMKYLLFFIYGGRALFVFLYLLAPKTDLTFYLFACGLGFTWLATVPPTAGLVGKLFGTRYLATLFGMTLLSHQVGGFLGAWLGGLAVDANGNYQWMWYADIALASMAALLNLPIREPRVVTKLATA